MALINAVQLYCYDETRIMKTFPQLLKVIPVLFFYHIYWLGILKILYNKDCISAQAIIYLHQKGAKPQGKQHFLKAAETLVKVRFYVMTSFSNI